MTTISTSNYEFTYGRKPRGDGYWAFFFRLRSGKRLTVWFSGLYRDCARMAEREASRRGDVCRIEVAT